MNHPTLLRAATCAPIDPLAARQLDADLRRATIGLERAIASMRTGGTSDAHMALRDARIDRAWRQLKRISTARRLLAERGNV